MRNATVVKEGVEVRDRPDGALPAPGARPHICFVAPYVWPVLARDTKIKIAGGAEVQQSILARLFRRAGYRVSVVCMDFGQPARTEVDGIQVLRTYGQDEGLPVLRFLHPRLTSVWSALKEANADIYYQRSAAMLTGLVAEFCRRHGRKSIFAGASDNDFEKGKQQIRFARDRWIFEHGLRRADRVVAQNPNQIAACEKHYGRTPVLIPSCYEPPADSRPGAGDIVLWVATIHEYKRPEWVLEIARRLPHRRFVMIGGISTRGTRLTPGYYEGIREAASRIPNVDFKGFLPLAQVEPWFDRARVLLNTSVYEGVPNTFMQAWSRGVPSVSTVDIGARINGSPVYNTFSDVEEGSREVERLFADELHYARASGRCRQYFDDNHSTAHALEAYERLFDGLIRS